MRKTTSLRLSVLTLGASRRLHYIPDALLSVDARGRIADLRPAPKALPQGTQDLSGRLAIPGLIDAHCHLSQYPAVASDGLELLPWLKKNIFPLETRFRGEKTRPAAAQFFRALAAHGTTCAAVYTSIWQDSAQVCFEEALASGLRVIMGKVMMDRGSYDHDFGRLHPGASRRGVSLRESEELCRVWHEQGGGRILYAFTPRFALSCSPELLAGAAKLAQRYGAYVQTHMAENRREVAEVRAAFPDCASYTEVYEKAGLLGPRTILAHCIWLSEGEYRVLERRRPAVAHCPISNAFLQSGILNAGRMKRGEISLALGSDVAGGPTLDLFEVMRQAVYAQRLARAHGIHESEAGFSAEDAFSMATLGGARALGLADRIGSLEKGKSADFVVLNPALYDPAPSRKRPAAEVLAQVVYRASSAAVSQTYVEGRRVWP